MADQHNDNIPALANTIASDVPDIKENLEWHKDCFQHICNGFSNTVTTSLGFVRHIWVPADQMVGNITSGATFAQSEYTTYSIMRSFFSFISTSMEFAHFEIVMPPGWNRSTIKAKFYWSSDTGSTAGDTVEWAIWGIAIGNDDALDVDYGTGVVVSDTLLANNGADLQISNATGAVTIGGSPALGDMINIRIGRNVSGTDDMTEEARLFGVMLEITETFPDASGTNAIATW